LNHDNSIRQLQGPWIIEFAELHNVRGKEVETVKAFLSKQEDDLVDKYEKLTTRLPRRCAFFGTTNKSNFLSDSTGNRRWWPVWVERADVQRFIEVRDLIWAEAVKRYMDGEDWWLSPEVEVVAAQEQELRRSHDAWQPLVDSYIRKLERDLEKQIGQGTKSRTLACRVEDVFGELDIEEKDWTNRDAHRIRECLEARGFVYGAVRVGGEVIKGYGRPYKRRDDG
jgi:predicted P-loop ATPase